MSDVRSQLTKLRRRRGVIRSSITRLEKRLQELEDISEQPGTVGHARELAVKLEALATDFRTYHFDLIDLIGDEEGILFKEQEILDDHDDLLADLNIRLKRLLSSNTSSTTDHNPVKLSIRKLQHLERGMLTIRDEVAAMPPDHGDISLVEQYESRLSDSKIELSEIRTTLLSVEENEEVRRQLSCHSRLEDLLFKCSFLIRKLMKVYKESEATINPLTGTGVRLPKLAIPTFDGNILDWRQFWEQFCVSVHSRPTLSNAEKLVYLQQALKGGSAKSIIEGLSQTGEQYEEAVKCLTARFDRPRLLHQTHVKMILDAPQARDGSGRELRCLHDVAQQHIRALKSMGQEPSPAFLTSIIELKLDATTMFEWQRHTQALTEVPHYKEILEFLDHRAQASEISTPFRRQSKAESSHTRRFLNPSKAIASVAATHETSNNRCVLCKIEKHPLYSCPKFRSLSHEEKLSTIRVNKICMNCLGRGHFVADCKSLHRCRQCQGPHHTLLHVNQEQQRKDTNQLVVSPSKTEISANSITTNSCSLLMTCQVMVFAPNGTTLKVRALLDSGSSASFVSERLVQSLRLSRIKQKVSVTGIAGASPNVEINSIATFEISPTTNRGGIIPITALVVPRVVRDLPTTTIPFDTKWSHLSNLHLADPDFNIPGRVDILLGIDVFTDALLDGRRRGPSGTPVAIKTLFGWVLCGSAEPSVSLAVSTVVCHSSVELSDDIIHKFWEMEEPPRHAFSHLSYREQMVIQHFRATYSRNQNGRIIVPLPKRSNGMVLGESRSQAVRRFLSLERSLHLKNQFSELDAVIQEYFNLQHAEPVPSSDLQKPTNEVFYLPSHAVYKRSSTTTQVRAVFDASAKSTSGVSLNDTLLNGPTIHPPLLDVLLRFRLHRVALTADVSKMYRAIELAHHDRDLHRFVWRSRSIDPLRDYRMTRVTFGVSASSFIANMSVLQNALDFEHEFPLAARVVKESFYVDDCLTGADNVEEALCLHHQLSELFHRGGFLLRKWNSSDSSVMESIDPELRDSIEVIAISGPEKYTRTLGLEWSTTMDRFRLTINSTHPTDAITKRLLVSDIAKIFDVLGWYSPTIIKMKILLQQLWEAKLDWDDIVPSSIQEVWLRWKSELPLLSSCYVQRYLFPKNSSIINMELHGFSDASEDAYSGVVYIRGEDAAGNFHVALVMAKTKVAPLKRLSIPRLELCGAHLVAQLLDHIRGLYQIPNLHVYAWTDSTIVLNWLKGSSRKFRPFVGNRISSITDCIPPNCWDHVNSSQNPADCASRGLFPSELSQFELWWRGPRWLTLSKSEWPDQQPLYPNEASDEERELCLITTCHSMEPVIPLDRFSTFRRFQRVLAWMLRFVNNCRSKEAERNFSSFLSVDELYRSERYWIATSQTDNFIQELSILRSGQDINLPRNSVLRYLHPFMDVHGLIRVGGRLSNSKLSHSRIHPIVLHGRNPITRLIILSEHHRMLHAGPSLLSASLSLRFHIIGLRRTVRLITHQCVKCRRYSGRITFQQQGQLPQERITPGPIFEKVGVDYAGPFNVKHGHVRKPLIVKAYVCLFVSLTVKAVHIEVVSDLTTEAFIAALRRFISRRGLPSLIWSDHGTNFVGADRELKDLYQFLKNKDNQSAISDFCSGRMIEWRYIPERTPHFGGLWESAVKSMKTHLRRTTSNIKLTFEELSTIMCQIEACLNSRPLIPLECTNENIVEILTPGHFLIGRPINALPDDCLLNTSDNHLTLSRRWELCQNVVNHFWRRWSIEYLTSLNKYSKWPCHTKNVAIGDVIVLRDETLFPTRWPLAKIIDVHPGKDGLVRIVTVKTQKGIYTRPITKIVVVCPARKPVPD